MSDQITERARAIDDRIAEVDLSASARVRIAERLGQEAERYGEPRVSARTWSGLAYVGGLATAVAVFFGLSAGWSPDVSVETTARAHVDGFVLLSRDCSVERDGDAVAIGRDCHVRLDDLGIDMRVLATSSVVAHERGVEVRDGWVVFDVEKVRAGQPPVSVTVPAGQIEVLGTQFVVSVGSERGQVELVEGSIAFSDLHGDASMIEPGQRVAWSRSTSSTEPDWVAVIDPPADVEVSPESAVSVDEPTPRAERESSRQSAAHEDRRASTRRKLDDEQALAAALSDVQRLRAVRRYQAALRELKQLERQVRDPKVREVLGYEAGTLLEASGQRRHACTHWRQYTRKYPDGRRRDDVARRLRDLECDE